MLSSRINANDNNDDDDDDDEGESAMPGDYEQWPKVASRIPPSRTAPPPRPAVPPTSRPSRRPPMRLPARSPKRRPPIPPNVSPVRPSRPRRRSITPKIVIERRSHHHRSSGRDRVITIPLDNRPTLGLRGPPKRVLEIERVRCRRRHKCRAKCYEDDYGIPPPQPQSNVVMANPVANPCLPPVQSSLMASNSSAFFSNITPEMIENLPKQTVHLPPIHLPGSQADANTELQTVIFPAEIINPINGTLSIIQTNPSANASGNANIQHSVTVPVQPQFISMPTNVRTSLATPAIAPSSLMQHFRNLVQQLSFPQTQPSSSPSPPNPPLIQSSSPVIPRYSSPNNAPYNPQIIPIMNTTNTGPYLSTNIRPTNTPNIGPYRATTSIPTSTPNPTPYRPSNYTPSSPANTMPYRLANITPYRPSNYTPASPANPTPYRPSNYTPSSPANTMPYRLANITPYRPSNYTPASPANPTPYRPSNYTPSSPANPTPYRQANITSYRPASFTSSIPASIQPYRAPSIVPSNFSDIGPYRAANITPYGAMPNRSNSNSMPPFSVPSGSMPYIPSSSLASSGSINSYPVSYSNPSDIGNNSIHASIPSQTPYQPGNPMPKSILRNSPFNSLSNITYTRSNPPSVSCSNTIVRKTTKFA